MTWIQFVTTANCSYGVGNLPQISLIGPRARSAGSRSPKFEECWAFSFIRCSSILSTVLRTFRPDIPSDRAWEFPLPLVLSTTVTAVEFEHFPWAHKMPASRIAKGIAGYPISPINLAAHLPCPAVIPSPSSIALTREVFESASFKPVWLPRSPSFPSKKSSSSRLPRHRLPLLRHEAGAYDLVDAATSLLLS